MDRSSSRIFIKAERSPANVHEVLGIQFHSNQIGVKGHFLLFFFNCFIVVNTLQVFYEQTHPMPKHFIRIFLFFFPKETC